MRASIKTETAVSLLVAGDHDIPHDKGVPKTEWAMPQQMHKERAENRQFRRMAAANVEADLAAAGDEVDGDYEDYKGSVADDLQVARNLIDRIRDYVARQDVLTRPQAI
jgi:hypothetical protein